MKATAAVLAMRFVDEDRRAQILAELRKSITARGAALEMEEEAARLINQIERLARLPKTTEATRH